MIKIDSERVSSILEAMVDGVYVVDEDLKVEYMNDEMVRIIGPGVGRRCSEVIHGNPEVCDWCRAKEVFEGKTVRWEQFVENSGKTFDVIEFPLKNSDGTRSKVSIFRDMSEMKKREEELALSEADFKRLFEHVACGAYFSSKEGKILNANQALLDMLGYDSKAEFLDIDIAKDLYLRPEDRRTFQELIEKDGKVIDYEVDFKRKEGTGIPVLLTSHVRYDREGRVSGYEGIIVDESQRKQMEEDYRRLFENVGCGVFISSKEGKFLNANQALLDMLGYGSKEEFLDIDIAKDLYVSPEDRKKFQEMIERDGKVIEYEVDFKRIDGTHVPTLLTANVRTDQQEKVIGYEGINVDLTQRKQMEKELRAAHDFMNKIIMSSPNAIMATDMKGNIIIWNTAAEETIGYKAQEVVGKMNIEKIYPEGTAKEVMKRMRSPDYGSEGRLTSYPMMFVRQDGQIIEGNLSSAIISDPQGGEIATVGIFVDLKERAEMERKLRDTQEQLLQSEKLAAMGKLTSQIAHELNNPLYGIMNTLELLKTEVAPQSKRRKILDMSLSETVRITDLLRKMLSFSKPDEEERQPTDINTILDEILLLVQKQLLEHSIRIAYEFADELPSVIASRNQLRQVFLNLFANARDAMPEGGTLTIKTTSHEGQVFIEVTDTGTGIKEENLDKIFDAFFTTKDTVKDVGLGLSVCYGFIQDHGGDIKVMSKQGEGTTFRVILPVLQEEE